jgi:large subunit ribosomal protein L9
MEIILLENVRNLGKFGAKVNVRKGFGRNFLVPQGKAVPATKDNLAQFEAQRSQLEKAAQDKFLAAQERAAEINNLHIIVQARAGDEGKLYGSIGTIELVKHFQDKGVSVVRNEIRLPNGPLRELGETIVELQLHAEVVAKVKVTIVPEEQK